MHFLNFVSSVQVLDDEWRKLRFTNIPFDYTDIPVDEFWGRLGRITNGNEVPLFGSVYKFMKCLLALLHSSADAERLFSAVTLIKSKSQNRLNTDTFTALLLAKEGVKDLSPTEDCTKFCLPPEMIELMGLQNLSKPDLY